MKFGVFCSINEEKGKNAYNVGDVFQSVAVLHLYEKMGIKQEDIFNIDFYSLNHYNGDYLILPFVNNNTSYKNFIKKFPLSPRIIPVFFGFNMNRKDCDDFIPYLTSHQPILTRDEDTMNILRHFGVEAYTVGCITLTLPKRVSTPESEKIFFVDISQELLPYIPEKLLSSGELITHDLSELPEAEQPKGDEYQYVLNFLERYKNEASLVVTSRLHAAVPCIAMGIPVILAINNIDVRFSWLEKLIPLYDLHSYSEINWNPKSIDIEDMKKKMERIFKKQIHNCVEKYNDIVELTEFLESREKVEYDRVLKTELMNSLSAKKGKTFRYVLWSVGAHASIAHNTMKEEFPEAELVAVVDKHEVGKIFFDCVCISKEKLSQVSFDFAILASYPGRFDAKKTMDSLNKKQGEDYCFFISRDITDVTKQTNEV